MYLYHNVITQHNIFYVCIDTGGVARESVGSACMRHESFMIYETWVIYETWHFIYVWEYETWVMYETWIIYMRHESFMRHATSYMYENVHGMGNMKFSQSKSIQVESPESVWAALEELPPPHMAALVYLIAFLRELLLHNPCDLTPETLALVYTYFLFFFHFDFAFLFF